MLEQVRSLIQEIADFVSTQPDFEATVTNHGTQIVVANTKQTDVQPTMFDGYELVLYRLAARGLNSDIEFKVANGEDTSTFVITSNATHDFTAYIRDLNLKVRSKQDDVIQGVFLGENPDRSSEYKYSVLTTYTNGTWASFLLSPAELTFAGVTELELTANDNGVFVLAGLVEMSDKYFAELEAELSEK